jgi:hypothetical protein
MGSDEQKSTSIPSVRYPATDALSALRAPRRDLRVAEGETAMVGPGAREANSFHLVSVGEYSDLQALDLVPRELEHESVRAAIEADDADAYALARDFVRAGPPGHCGCNGRSFELRKAYSGIRRQHHPNLASVLSDHFGRPIAWDDLHPRVVRAWHSRLVDVHVPLLVGLLALNDIDIAAHGTMQVPRTVDVLNAREIQIGGEGRLDFQGGGVKVRCTSLTGPGLLWKDSLAVAVAATAVNRAVEAATP